MMENERRAGNADLRSAEGSSSRKGWYSRGYLPHFDGSNTVQFITFRFQDSVPKAIIQNWLDELRLAPEAERVNHVRRRIEKYMDAGRGACWLRRPEAARAVEETLLFFDGERYRLLAWVIMPNHVHLLAEFLDPWAMSTVVKSWKTYSAHLVNEIVGRRGRLWHREYFDRFIRDDFHFQNTLAYIENNPVKAEMAPEPHMFPFSSAWRRLAEEESADRRSALPAARTAK